MNSTGVGALPTLFCFPSPNSSHSIRKTLAPLKLGPSNLPQLKHKSLFLSSESWKISERGFGIRCSSGDASEPSKWARWVPKGVVAERVLRLISGATSSPICIPWILEFKLVWLLALVVLPARSHIVMRFGLVIYLVLMSIWILPKQLWMDQLGRVGLLSGILFVMLGLGSDGAPSLVQLTTPSPTMMNLPSLPSSFSGYSYLVMKLGPLQLARKGLSVASTSACLTFTFSLLMYVGSLKNICSHAVQISQAMIVRGFRGDSQSHKIYFLSDSLGMADIIVILLAFLESSDTDS